MCNTCTRQFQKKVSFSYIYNKITSKPAIMQYLSVVSYYKLCQFLMTDTHHANDFSLVTSLQTSERVTILLIYFVSVLSMYLPMHNYHQGQYKFQLPTATSSSMVFSLKLYNYLRTMGTGHDIKECYLLSDSDRWRHRASRLSTSSWSLRCSRRFSSRMFFSSLTYRCIFSVSDRSEYNFLNICHIKSTT